MRDVLTRSFRFYTYTVIENNSGEFEVYCEGKSISVEKFLVRKFATEQEAINSLPKPVAA